MLNTLGLLFYLGCLERKPMLLDSFRHRSTCIKTAKSQKHKEKQISVKA